MKNDPKIYRVPHHAQMPKHRRDDSIAEQEAGCALHRRHRRSGIAGIPRLPKLHQSLIRFTAQKSDSNPPPAISTGTPHLAARGAPAPILQRGSSHLGEMPPCVFPDVFLFGSIRF